MLLDISKLHHCCANHALEGMFKALADEDGLGHDIWAAHENPFIQALIEKFSERGLLKIEKVHHELLKWMAGEYVVPDIQAVPVPPGFMGRWTQQEMSLVRTYLENIPPDSLTLDDWGLLIDYLVQRYLPADQLQEQAEWLAVKSGLMGKVQAHLGDIAAGAAMALVQALPSTVKEAGVMFRLSDVAESVLAYGKARACDAVVALSETARHRIRRVVVEHQAQRLAGAPVKDGTLQQKLLDEFGTLNRDWRRIAITEAGEMANQGVIASLKPGQEVRRMEMYRGACPFCKKLDGRIFRVTTADDPEKDGTKDVWVGKTNVGRGFNNV